MDAKDWLPSKESLVQIVNQFNRRNETSINYLRNQYNGLENYSLSYCNERNEFLTPTHGSTTGIKYKLENVLYKVINEKNEINDLLNSREVAVLAHFKPLIFDDSSHSTQKHKRFIFFYNKYRNNANNKKNQEDAFKNLISLLYLVRCNIAHTGKSSYGPDKAKIKRDSEIANLFIDINILIFNILMNHPERKLACYGTLINSTFVDGMVNCKGKVDGFLQEVDGFKYFTYELNTGSIDVELYISMNNAIDFTEIDHYEGKKYQRILIPTYINDKVYIANIYEENYNNE